MTDETIAFVVPVRNAASPLQRCLASIRRTAGPHVEIIVVDNGSTDGSPAVATAAGARVLSLPGVRVSALRNAGAASASAAVLAFVDADHEVSHHWLPAATAVMADPSVGGAGARYTAPPKGTWVQRTYGLLRGTTRGRHPTDWLGSGNLLVRVEAFRQVGGFDERLDACEDVDLCQRLTTAGWTLVADEGLHSIHWGDPTTIGALFRAERWRGRNNLRVSLRPPRSIRGLLSAAMPVVTLAGLFVLGVGLFGMAAGCLPGWVPLVGALFAFGWSALRAARMATGADARGVLTVLPCLAVATTYDLARAIALVTRASHHRQLPQSARESEAAR